jgi:glycosyltransferase involved in cell wall biosynthesis
MRIAIDLRSLQTKNVSGVENYTSHLLEHLLALDKTNQYVFFYNALKAETPDHLSYVNATNVRTRIPNKLFNFSIRAFGRPYLEKLTGDFDIVFLPNVNHVAHGPGKKTVITVHDLSPFIFPEFHSPKHRLWHAILNTKKVYEQADALISVSEFTKNDLISHFGIPEHKIHVVHPGVDHESLQSRVSQDELRHVRNVYGLPTNFLLFLSTLEPRKNVKGLIKAFEQVNSDAHLLLVGKPGWKHKEIFSLINDSKKRKLISYLGYVNEADKPALISLAQAVVYPSFYEGFGFVPLEAMSLGTPVLTSQVSSIPEVVSNAALLINPYNHNDLVFAISEILSNENLRTKLISQGRAQAMRYQWDISAQKTLAVFEQLS